MEGVNKRNLYLYILAVLPSNSGIATSGAVAGYVTGIWKARRVQNFRWETSDHKGEEKRTYVKLHVEFVLQKLVDVPAFSKPPEIIIK